MDPALIAFKFLPARIGSIERWIGKDIVELLIGQLITGKDVSRFQTQICSKPTDCKAHCRQSPSGGIALLPVDRNVVNSPTMRLHKLLTGDKHSP
jgi:hypothetical protein